MNSSVDEEKGYGQGMRLRIQSREVVNYTRLRQGIRSIGLGLGDLDFIQFVPVKNWTSEMLFPYVATLLNAIFLCCYRHRL